MSCTPNAPENIYTPTTDEMREIYVQNRRVTGSLFREADFEFNRWLSAHNAKVCAEAWAEGFDAGSAAGGRWAENGGSDSDDVNPYSLIARAEYEIPGFDGTRDALDALTIRAGKEETA